MAGLSDAGFVGACLGLERKQMPSRRLKILKIPNDLLVGLLSLDGSKRIRIGGLPPDARIVAVSDKVYFDQDCMAFKVESDSFPEIESTDTVIPPLTLTVTEIRSGGGPEFL